MSKTQKLILLQQEQALRAATIQVEKLLHNSPPLTLKQIQEKSWFRRRLLRQALESHDRITGHGPKGKHRTYEIDLLRGHPIPQLEERLKTKAKSPKIDNPKATPGAKVSRQKKGKTK